MFRGVEELVGSRQDRGALQSVSASVRTSHHISVGVLPWLDADFKNCAGLITVLTETEGTSQTPV